MKKSEVYSWRLSPQMKAAIEERARAEGTTMAKLLDRIVGDWLGERTTVEEEAEQRRLHAAAARTIGTIRGGDPHLAEQASERVKEILRRKYDR